MKQTFIKTSDRETADKLRALGFQAVSEHNGITTFLNNVNLPNNFAKNNIVYSNLIGL